MASRQELQEKLEELLGSRNVYYQPPETVKMEYPAIRYSKNRIDMRHANDDVYIKRMKYTVIVISKTPDHPVIDKLLALPYCSYDRQYKSGNLNHDVLTLYF